MKFGRFSLVLLFLLAARTAWGGAARCNLSDSAAYYAALANEAEDNLVRDTLLERALFFAQTPDYNRATLLRYHANNAFKIGHSAEAQQELIEAYTIFMRLQEWDWAAMCLYERSIDYLNIGDYDDMADLLRLLSGLLRYDTPIIRYNYYSVASDYYMLLDSTEKAISLAYKAIDAVEQIPHPEQYQILPVWNYYNLAFMLDASRVPPPVDSIEYWLQKAEQAINPAGDWVDIEEAHISIMDMRAWLCYYRGEYPTAEQLMQHVLVKIDSVAQDTPNTIITERGEAYRFLAMIYEEQGRWQEALHYQQLLNDNNLLRYDAEKNATLQDIEARYETERRQLEMERLEAKNAAFRWMLVVCGLLFLSGGLLFVVVVLRKRRAEDRLYEAALEQENMRSAIREMQSNIDIDTIHFLQNDLLATFRCLPNTVACKQEAIHAIETIDTMRIGQICKQVPALTALDKRYLMCFVAGLTVEQVAVLFDIAPASVYTVRYRMRKKFPEKCDFLA